jgi:hypothetical protein
MPFEKGNSFGILKGKNKQRNNYKRILTNVTFSDISCINDVTRDVLRNINEALNHKDEAIRYDMSKSMAKYLFSTKKETINVTASFEDFLKEIEKGNNKPKLVEFVEIPPVNNLLSDNE